MATKALVAGLAKQSWDELTQNVTPSAGDFENAYGDDEDEPRGNNDDNNVFIEVECRHDDHHRGRWGS
jgi:hypothetical protein